MAGLIDRGAALRSPIMQGGGRPFTMQTSFPDPSNMFSSVQREGMPAPQGLGNILDVLSRLRRPTARIQPQAEAFEKPVTPFVYGAGTEPMFATAIGEGPQSTGIAYKPYIGGAVAPNSVFATGRRKVGGPPIMDPWNRVPVKG